MNVLVLGLGYGIDVNSFKFVASNINFFYNFHKTNYTFSSPSRLFSSPFQKKVIRPYIVIIAQKLNNYFFELKFQC